MKTPLLTGLVAAALAAGFATGYYFAAGDTSAPAPSTPTPAPAVAANSAALARDLAEARERIDELETRLATPATLPAAEPPANAAPSTPPPANDLEAIVQESRPLLNRMMPVFQRMMERGIDQQVSRLVEQLGLDEAQSALLREKLTTLGQTEMEKFSQRLNDPGVSPEQLFRGEGGPFNPQALNNALKETLTPDQFADYEQKQTAERVERLERQTNAQVERLGNRLSLSENQKDQVFAALVKSSDPGLQVETESSTAAEIPPTPHGKMPSAPSSRPSNAKSTTRTWPAAARPRTAGATS
jgi:hypothetical protein